MVTIIRLEFKSKYQFIWLRYITGINLKEHCIKCLIGYRDRRVKAIMSHRYALMELKEAKYYYICGVKNQRSLVANVHIAFKHVEGSKVQIDNEYVLCEIHNAEQFHINDRSIDWSLPQSANRLYNRCRNWQFANQVVHEFPMKRKSNKHIKPDPWTLF